MLVTFSLLSVVILRELPGSFRSSVVRGFGSLSAQELFQRHVEILDCALACDPTDPQWVGKLKLYGNRWFSY